MNYLIFKPSTRFFQFIVILVLLLSLGNSTTVSAAGEMTVKPITWNVIGLDSNNTSAGPNIFPVGVRVCNSTSTAINGISPTFFWGTGSTPDNTNSAFIYLRPGSYGNGVTYPVFTLQPKGSAGDCKDVYYEVEINRSQVGGVYAYNKTRRYTISFSGTQGLDIVTASSPTPREIFVERLVSQNRNYVQSVKYEDIAAGTGLKTVPAGGTMNLVVGKTYNIELVGATATQGYEQIEAYINFDNTIFKVNSVTTTYSANAGTDPLAGTKLYADGCGWVNDPNSPLYRSCTSTGKYGGNVTTTYNITILKVGSTQTLMSLIYDYSGSSYHYNADYITSARLASISAAPTATISKTFSPSSIVAGSYSTLTFTINNPTSAAITGVNFIDNLPGGVSVYSSPGATATNCGTGATWNPTSTDTSLNFTNGTISANGTCTLKVNVIPSSNGTFTNTTNHLFVNGSTDTGSFATATLTRSAAPTYCTRSPIIAQWTVPSASTNPPDLTGGVPTTNNSGFTTANVVAAVPADTGLSTTAQNGDGRSWSLFGFKNAGNFVTFTVDTRYYSSVVLDFYLSNDTGGNGPTSATYEVSVNGGTYTAPVSFTIPQPGVTGWSLATISLPGASTTGTTAVRLRFAGAKNDATTGNILMDNITFSGSETGCVAPPPTISKSFITKPLILGNTTTLRFSIANTTTGAQNLTGVAFTDVLPAGLTVTTGSIVGTCSAGSTGTISTTSPSTISLTSGSLLASGNCTFNVTVAGAIVGDYTNNTTSITSTQSGVNTGGANIGFGNDTISVIAPPQILKYFGATAIYNTVPGNTTSLTFVVSNPNPSVTLTGVTFSDTLPLGITVASGSVPGTCSTGSSGTATATSPSAITLLGGSLLAGGSCTFSVTVTGTTAGTINNSVSVSSTNGGAGITSTATINVIARMPGLEFSKQIGLSSTGPWYKYLSIPAGTTVYYNFTAYNTGDVDLTNVAITDDKLPSPICTIASLPVQTATESGARSCVSSGIITASGSVVNTGYASTTYNSSPVTSNTSSATYATTEISLTKSAQESYFAAAGDVLHYNFLVTNTGQASLFGQVSIADPLISAVCPEVNTVGDFDDWFDNGEALTCTGSYTILAGDVTTGSVSNTATASISGVTSPSSSVTIPLHKGTLVIDKVTVPSGDATSFNFTATGSGNTGFSLADASPMHSVPLNQGTYTVSEDSLSGWSLTNIACVVTGTHGSSVTIGASGGFDAGDSAISVDLKADDTVTCTFTNSRDPQLTLQKTVVNDNGGTATKSNFTPRLSAVDKTWDTALVVPPGSYTLNESSLAGYASSSWSCVTNGGSPTSGDTISLAYGDVAVCSITNNDIAPSLTLVKTVNNDDGGTALASDWTLTATGPTNLSGLAPVSSGSNFQAGTYTLGETGPTGYTSGTYSCVINGGGAVSGNSITLALGDVATCTINNDDIAPTLKLVKTVTNNNGGTQTAADWTLTASGTSLGFSDSGDSSTAHTVRAGVAYTLSENAISGYSADSWSCDSGLLVGNVLTLSLAQNAICSITNDDIAPSLTLIKSVINNNGGTAAPGEWTLTATGSLGSPTNLSGTTPVSSTATFKADTYTLGESDGPDGYAAGTYSCVFGANPTPVSGNVITLGLGESATCTVINNDISPQLTVIKHVINDNGGILSASDFTMSVLGTNVSDTSFAGNETGTTVTLDVGTYSVDENPATGYSSSYSADCSGTIALGETKTCTVTNDDVAATLTLVKTVVNDDGGMLNPTDFTPYVDTTIVGWGTAIPLSPGTYTVSENTADGYTASAWGGDCAVDGSITLANGDNKTCTITNDDIAPTLTLNKIVVNSYGGTLTYSDFPVFIGSTAVTWGEVNTLRPGSYTVSETTQSGYSAGTWGGDCAADGSITLALGENKTCSITNTALPATLIVKKVVLNDNGGTLAADYFSFNVNGGTTTYFEADGQNNLSIDAGTYSVSEPGVSGYTTSYDNCSDLVIGNGETQTCTITNDDVAPTLRLGKTVINDNGGTKTAADWTLTATGSTLGFSDAGNSSTSHSVQAGVAYTLTENNIAGYSSGTWSCDTGVLVGNLLTLGVGEDAICSITNNDVAATLTLVKTVVNDNGGTLSTSDFTPYVDSVAYTWGTPIPLAAGIHTASESTVASYSSGSWGGDCAADGSITLANGENKTCSITNDDIAPSLTLIKNVVNNNGGTVATNEWTLTATGSLGSPTNLSGTTPVSSTTTFKADTYTLGESGGPDGYTSGTYSCVFGADPTPVSGNVIALELGESATCTIINNDMTPQLTVIKLITNDNGGSLTSPDFTMNVTGTNVSSSSFAGSETGTTVTLDAGVYSVAENPAAGYSPSYSADCSGTIAVGETKICTVTNDDVGATLTLVKTVVNDDGGTLTAANFTPYVDLSAVTWGVPAPLDAGTYTASESTMASYTSSVWGGDCAPDGSITLVNGDNKTCTITNNDVAPTLTLVKTVTNDNGGTLATGNFPAFINSTAVNWGEVNSLSAGSYTVSETTQSGYSAGTWGGDCATDGSITLALGDVKTCTINNDDVAPSLTLKASVINNFGGTAVATDWTLSATGGPTPMSGSTDLVSDATFSAGSYILGHTSVPGYAASSWSCTVNGAPVSYSSSLVLNLGDVAECSIQFSDIQPTLTLTKTVDNTGGFFSLTQADFPAFITSVVTTPATWDTAYSLNAGSYIVSEATQTGYTAGNWGGDCAADGTVNLAIGESKTCTITNTADNPAIMLTKSGNLDMTITTPGTMVNPGDRIDYSFTVTNSGNSTLHSVHVDDTACDAAPVLSSGDTNTNSELDRTETWILVCSHTLTQPEIEAGSFINNATVYGTSPFDIEVNDSDSITTNFSAVYALGLHKESSTVSVSLADYVIPYTITLFNGGNMPVENIVVSDPKCSTDLAYQSGDTNEDHILQVTEEWIYTCSYKVTQADIDLGLDISNTVTAMADRIDPQVEATLDIPVIKGPAIQLTKSGSLNMNVVSPGTLTNPGDTITYTFSVENIGNVTLWDDITVTDPLLPELNCVIPVSNFSQFPTGLTPGSSASCSATNNVYTLTAEDIAAGEVSNTSTALTTYEGTPVSDDHQIVTATIPVRQISLEKTANPTTFTAAGQVITYTYSITNNGNLDLYPAFTVVDDKVTSVICPSIPNPLVPGGSVDCTGDYTVTAEDVAAKTVINHATAFVNTTDACTEGCILVQDDAQATINQSIPQPTNTSANANMAFLPATGFAPGAITTLSAQTEPYTSTDLVLSIPSLQVSTVITGVPNHDGEYAIDWLWNEAGWLQGTAFPGSIGNSVITGHVYLPNGRPGPFVDLKTLTWGQKIIVEQFGKSYIYEVRNVKRVKPEDVSVISHKDYGYLTLITCQGYDLQSESYLYRTVVQAILVDIR